MVGGSRDIQIMTRDIEIMTRDMKMSRPTSVEEPPVAPTVTLHSRSRPYSVRVTLPVDGKGTQIDMYRHDALVKILCLNCKNIHVQKAQPTDGASIIWPRWIRRILPSKRFHTWLETLRWLGFIEDELDKLEDIDDVFDLLVQCDISTFPTNHCPKTSM